MQRGNHSGGVNRAVHCPCHAYIALSHRVCLSISFCLHVNQIAWSPIEEHRLVVLSCEFAHVMLERCSLGEPPKSSTHLLVLCFDKPPDDRTLRLLDLKSRKPVEVFKLDNSKSGKDWVSAAWSDDGQYLAALDEGDNLSLIDPRKGKVLKEKQLRQEVSCGGVILWLDTDSERFENRCNCGAYDSGHGSRLDTRLSARPRLRRG